MAMKVIRCRICGETYLGEETPDKCPFCGVQKGFLVPATEWVDENVSLDLTDVSRENVLAAIELEVSNTRFYLCAAAEAKDPELSGMFKRLSKVEREHASLLSKMLGQRVPEEIETPLECSESGLDNVEESSMRETNAIAKYSEFLAQSTENRAKTVFAALIGVEKTHLELDHIQKERLDK